MAWRVTNMQKDKKAVFISLCLAVLCSSCTVPAAPPEALSNLQAINYGNYGNLGEKANGEVYCQAFLCGNEEDEGIVRICPGERELVLSEDVAALYCYEDELYYTSWERNGLYYLSASGDPVTITDADVRSVARSGGFLYVVTRDKTAEVEFRLWKKAVDEVKLTEVTGLPAGIMPEQVYPSEHGDGVYVVGITPEKNGPIYFLSETGELTWIAEPPESVQRIFCAYGSLYSVGYEAIYQIGADGTCTSISKDFTSLYTAVCAYNGGIIYQAEGEQTGVVYHNVSTGEERLLSVAPIYLQFYVIGGKLLGIINYVDGGPVVEELHVT